MKETIYVFDVDGTLTSRDSLLEITSYIVPSRTGQLKLWLSIWPIIVLGLVFGDHGKIKEALLSKLWKGRKRTDIARTCHDFFNDHLSKDLKPFARQYIAGVRSQNPAVKMVLLSASCREWLVFVAERLQADLICTQLHYDNEDRFTGKFATPNCKGKEKLKRLTSQYPPASHEYICFGNSAADKQLQFISKEFYYRYF